MVQARTASGINDGAHLRAFHLRLSSKRQALRPSWFSAIVAQRGFCSHLLSTSICARLNSESSTTPSGQPGASVCTSLFWPGVLITSMPGFPKVASPFSLELSPWSFLLGAFSLELSPWSFLLGAFSLELSPWSFLLGASPVVPPFPVGITCSWPFISRPTGTFPPPRL